MTNAQLILFIVQNLNCTPLQAKKELLENRGIFELLELVSYERAYEIVERWDSMTPKDKKGRKEPKGKLISLVRKNKRRILESQFDEKAGQLRVEGRV